MFNSDTNSNTTDFDSYGFKKTSNQYIHNMISSMVSCQKVKRSVYDGAIRHSQVHI